MTETHNLQQANLQQRADRQAEKGASKGKARHAPHLRQQFADYDGTDESCSICMTEFMRHEKVYRLSCNHLFHQECYDQHMHVTFQKPRGLRVPQLPGPRHSEGTVPAPWNNYK